MSPEGWKRFEETDSCLNKIEVIGWEGALQRRWRAQVRREKLQYFNMLRERGRAAPSVSQGKKR
jgi:hypothetical protein